MKKISIMKKINPCWWVKNDDAPDVPGWFLPDRNEYYRRVRWLIRNPLHNFTWYVLGIADVEFSVSGTNPEVIFRDGWNIAVIEYGLLQLPFVSYQGKFKFYVGWRPDSGAFGFKITRR